MTGLRKWLNTLLGFSRTESNAFIILLPVVVFIVFSEPLTRWVISQQTIDFSLQNAKLDSLTAHWSVSKRPVANDVKPNERLSLFNFDPNKTTLQDLHRLGFSEKLAQRITNYSNKGGVFRIKSDLKKIYGMDSSLYKNLYAYILLPEAYDTQKDALRIDNKMEFKTVLRFDLNTADTTALKSVNGIGTTLAARIIKYRNRIGGFVSTAQLNEVYGLDSAVIQKLLVVGYLKDDFQLTKININTATQTELETHPYIGKSKAKAIVAYRFQHGNFKHVDDLRSLHTISNVDKIIPYVKVE